MFEGILAAAAGAAVLAVSAVPVQAAPFTPWRRLGDGSTMADGSPDGPVSGTEVHHYDYGSSYRHAAASAACQSLRTSISVAQPSGPWIIADTRADYRNDIVVPTGVSGSPGTLISLRLDERVLVQGGLFGDGRTLGSVDT